MTSTHCHLIRHVQRVRQHLSMEIPTTAMDAFAERVLHANAIVFLPDGSICDPCGRIDGRRRRPTRSGVGHSISAGCLGAQARTDMQLASSGLRTPPHLP